ncbi:hypothetical protein KPL71_014143 [Citrus sinensis]|uniref:Uncharacterized protein n=1 Tax=Citrus sinensis TaxID=2711 RepID=A0ACB8K9M7_CITSI|nr:hypothetical protein KPL71_014143 [Citrus sinensis]
MKMKAVLRKNNCLAAIGERPMEINDDKWNEIDGNAISDLHLALADEVLSSVAEKNIEKEIWDTLKKLYDGKSLHNKIFLKRKLYTLRTTESTMVADYVNALKTLFSQLTILGHNIEENEYAELILQSLPDSYDQLIINLMNNNPVDNLVFDNVAAFVLNEESRRKNKENRQARATWHMTSRREWFHTYQPISGGSVYMGNDHALEIAGIGTIKIKMFHGTIRTIGEVRHVNDLKKNLLSLEQIDSHGCKTHVENEIIKITRGVLVLMKVEKIGANLFMLKEETLQEQEGIQRQFTVAYTPQQNGVAEQMNMTLTERIRVILRTAGLPNSFWAKAAKIACYIVNRSPSTAIGLKTAMKMWTGKPTDYSYLHAFGCPVYVMYNAQERTKLDPKSRRCIFFGYADGVKGYRLWDPTAHKIVISRDVIFVEDQLQRKDENDGIQCMKKLRLYTKTRHGNLYHYHVEEKLLETNGFTRSIVMAMTSRTVSCKIGGERICSEKKLDVKTIFLHGELEEYIFMLQPEGFVEKGKENLVCRLNKSLYDFKQAPRNNMKFWLSQKNYLKKILRGFNMQSCIAQAVGAVSRYMANPGGEHSIAAKRIPRYIKETSDVALCYGGSEFTVRGYVDSDFAGDLDKRKSTTSYVFTLAGGAVSWISKLQTVVALSTTEAEYMAATQPCKEAIWIQRLLEELGHK